ncbi:MAG: glycosyltransferase [Clostridia bacterium]|nr:glycosyltransferase [Clostridia bacterium]
MKKLLFSAFDMNVGGIETSLLILLNTLVDKNYDITLVLEKKQGAFLKDLDNKIHIIEYKPSENKIVLVRKIINLQKRILFWLKHHNKYDFSASYATYSLVGSYTARIASKNCALWGHADYLMLYKNDASKVEEFFNVLNVSKFKKIIFVSKAGAESFCNIFPEQEEKVIFCNNLIDYRKIESLAQEKVEETKKKYTFVNVGRHDEKQKKLTRILEATKQLKEEDFDFEVLFVGEGSDTEKYKEMVKEYNIQDFVKFLGVKKNPYPYMKLADSIILTSDYEGYPVVFLEAFVLNKPIITTDIADALEDIQNKFGIVTSKKIEEIYQAMKKFIQKGYEIKEKFEPEQYNKNIIEKIENIINDD